MRRSVVSLLVVFAFGCADEAISQLAPKIEVTPDSLALSATPVGDTASHGLTVRSVGAVPLEIESIQLIGTASAPDDLGLRIEQALPTALSPSSALEVTITHVPRDATLDEGLVRIISNDPANAVVDVPIRHVYTGAARVAVVRDLDTADAEADTPGGVRSTVASIPFAVVAVGIRQVEQIDVVNIGVGSAPLVVSRIGLETTVAGLTVAEVARALGGESIALPALAAASPSATTRSIRVRIAWAPTIAGATLQANLQIESNDGTTPTVSIPITGETIAGDPPALRITPPTGIDIGAVALGSTGEDAFELHNDGTGPLFVQPLTIGTNPGGVFSLVDPPTAFEIPAGGQRSVAVRFSPAAAGVVSGAIQIASNDPSRPAVDYPIQGGGSDNRPCMPAMPDPDEPANDACNTAADLGVLNLPAGNQTHSRMWSDRMLEVDDDQDWGMVRVGVDRGCSGVGYSFNVSAALPGAEQGQVCLHVGDCSATPRCGPAASGARFLSALGGALCRTHNNAVPVYIHVTHTGGARSCQPYTVSFSAR